MGSLEAGSQAIGSPAVGSPAVGSLAVGSAVVAQVADFLAFDFQAVGFPEGVPLGNEAGDQRGKGQLERAALRVTSWLWEISADRQPCRNRSPQWVRVVRDVWPVT